MSGRFITFEGVDGSGKSTQIGLLADYLIAAGEVVRMTREPGGSPGAELIRHLLVEGDPGRWSAETEILLFAAARRDHVERVVQPALALGETVLSDRYADSTRVYQAALRPDLRPSIDQLHRMMIGIDPDLTIILDLDPETAMARGARRGGQEMRFERRGIDFQRKLRKGFLTLADQEPTRCRIVSAEGEPDAIAARIRTVVDESRR